MDPNALKIYVDGSAYRNPGHESGFAGIAVFPDDHDRKNEVIFSESYHSSTNQRMELSAVIWAFEYIRNNAMLLKISRAIIITDSEYVYDNQSRAQYWKKDGWESRTGKPIDNQDLWAQFLTLRPKVGVHVEIKWEKGKTSQILKDIDKEAKKASGNPIRKSDFGYKKGKIGKTNIKGGSALPFPFAVEGLQIRVYRYEHKKTKKSEFYKVYFESNEDHSGDFSVKYSAYILPIHLVKIHRFHCYLVNVTKKDDWAMIESIEEIASSSVSGG